MIWQRFGKLLFMMKAIDISPQQLEQWEFLPHRSEFIDRSDAVLAFQNELKEREAAGMDLVCGKGNSFCGIERANYDSEHFGVELGQIPFLITSDELCHDAAEQEEFASQILERARRRGFRHLSLSLPAEDVNSLRLLQKMDFRITGTLVTYWHTLSENHLAIVTAESIRDCRREDIPSLRRIAARCFSDRSQNVNRFNTDPFFDDAEKIGGVYADWIENAINGIMADHVFVYEGSDGEPLGFICMKRPRDGNKKRVGYVPLNAVSPDVQSRGIYRKLVDASIKWLRSNDADILEIGTQVSQYAMHRVWGRLGASITASHYRMMKRLD